MGEFLALPFFQDALIAIFFLAILSGIIGSLVVVNRMLFLVGGIAHSSYGGIGMAIYLGLPIYLGATLFSVAAAFLIALLSYKRRQDLEALIGMIWAGGMALGIIFIDMTQGYQSDLMGYLFGSILTIEKSDLWLMALIALISLLFVATRYQALLAVSYNSELAQLKVIPAKLYYTAILALASLSVVVAIKVVGLILVLALLSIPVYIAAKFSKTLLLMMLYASLLSFVFGVTGLLLSYHLDLSSGAVIVLVNVAGAMLFWIYKLVRGMA